MRECWPCACDVVTLCLLHCDCWQHGVCILSCLLLTLNIRYNTHTFPEINTARCDQNKSNATARKVTEEMCQKCSGELWIRLFYGYVWCKLKLLISCLLNVALKNTIPLLLTLIGKRRSFFYKQHDATKLRCSACFSLSFSICLSMSNTITNYWAKLLVMLQLNFQG